MRKWWPWIAVLIVLGLIALSYTREEEPHRSAGQAVERSTATAVSPSSEAAVEMPVEEAVERTETEEDEEDALVASMEERVRGTARVVLDTPSPRGTAQGTVRVSGWAADPEAATGTGVDEVRVWLIDGWPVTVTPLGRARYGLPRPDLVTALGNAALGAAGFTFEWDVAASGIPPGTYQLIAGARQGDRWSTSQVEVRVPGSPAAGGSSAAQTRAEESVTVGGVAFRRRETGAATLHYTEGVPAERVERAARAIDEAVARVPVLLSVSRPPGRIVLYLFPGTAQFQHDASQMGYGRRDFPTAGGFYVSPDMRFPGIYLNAALLGSDAGAMRAIAHEYVHHAIAVASQSRFPDVWLNEGLAEYVAYLLAEPLDPDGLHAELQDKLAAVVRAQKDGTQLSLYAMRSYTVLIGTSDEAHDRMDLIYAVGVTAVAILVRQYGLETVAAAAANGEDRRWWYLGFPRELHERLRGFEAEGLGGIRGRLPTILPEQAPAGRRFTFVATGFKRFEPLTLEVTQPDGSRYTLPVRHTDDTGTVVGSLRTLRSSPQGEWTIRIAGADSPPVTVTMTVRSR